MSKNTKIRTFTFMAAFLAAGAHAEFHLQVPPSTAFKTGFAPVKSPANKS
jgi:hypothetical protein